MTNLLFYLNNKKKKYNIIFFYDKKKILNIKKIYLILKYISCLSSNKKYCIENNKCIFCILFYNKKKKIYKKYDIQTKFISNFLLNSFHNIFFLENINMELINIKKNEKKFYLFIIKIKHLVKNIFLNKKNILINLKIKKNFDIINFIFNLNNNNLLNSYKTKYKNLNLKKIYCLILFLIKNKKIKFINLYEFINYYKFINIKNPNLDIYFFYYKIKIYFKINSSL